MPNKLAEFLEDFSLYQDRAERIDALIGLGGEFVNPLADEVPRTVESRVPGCESEVYLATEPLGDGLKFKFAVDNPQGISAMALARVLDLTLSGEPLDQVAGVSEDVVYDIFGRELSMGKSLGLTGMVRMVRTAAAR